MGSRPKTIEAILEGSLELFNRSGISDVSTNHIANHVGISPGNLYYYFPNKEAIVRAIFAQIRARVETLWDDSARLPLRLLTDYVNVVFRIIFGYRFFFAELTLILRRDEALRAEYIQLQTRFKEELAGLLLGLNQAGVLVSLEDHEKRMAMANSVWIVTIYWHCYLESAPQAGQPAPSRELLNHILFLLTPYIEPRFLDTVQGIFTSFLEARGHD
ncbi:MAG TPA: TetR/AcrR family transcriptional regulator [Oligoflexus sp.]|uniref:TetR/AcrR family transcriptional regulator n=1 Tax=Oligoflexus sp. TaxID=1971216 RepID=UPI002D599B2D|nr:TetR/AcrR family transcriptional regulator [Oligoflexus sp.]HYX36100.1 TetR/AcrR family transcriptional regulator [Oligoflexus sp.]